jgi:hypothetical protein
LDQMEIMADLNENGRANHKVRRLALSGKRICLRDSRSRCYGRPWLRFLLLR